VPEGDSIDAEFPERSPHQVQIDVRWYPAIVATVTFVARSASQSAASLSKVGSSSGAVNELFSSRSRILPRNFVAVT
jgi:hypothetical protein